MTVNSIEEKVLNRGFYFICIGGFFIMLSLATHLPAYPHMLEKFSLNAGYAVWMQLGLAVGLTGFQPLLGWVGDSFGIKLVLLLGGIFMFLGSLLVAFAGAFWILVFGLFLKGVSGACVAPSGVAYAGKYMIGSRRGKAMGTFAASITIGALFGPVLSGAIVDAFNWQMSFIFTALLGAIALALYLGVPYVKIEQRTKIDTAGVIFVIVLLLGLLTVPTFINTYGFSSGMWLPSLGVFIIALILLIVVEKRQKEPLIEIGHITNRTFWVPTLIAVLIFLGYSGVMYLLTFFVQSVQGKSATTVGILQMAIFGGTSLAAYISGRVLKNFSTRTIIGSAILVFAIGIIMLSFVHLETSFTYLFIAMSCIGIGSGISTPAVKALIVSQAPEGRINVVSFTNSVIENIAQRLGASFALVAFTFFSASGNNVKAMSNTSWFIMVFIVLAFLFLLFIPRRIDGIHVSNEKDNTLSSVAANKTS